SVADAFRLRRSGRGCQAMRLVAPNLQLFALGDFAAAPSIASLVPNVRIDLPAISAQAAKLTASIQITARARLAGRAVAVPARAGSWADQIHKLRLRTRRRIMGFGTYARQRLVPFVAALLSIALLYLLSADVAPAEDAGPPACSAKVLENCTPNPGD